MGNLKESNAGEAVFGEGSIPKTTKVLEYPIIGDDFESDQVEHFVAFAAYNVREVTTAVWNRGEIHDVDVREYSQSDLMDVKVGEEEVYMLDNDAITREKSIKSLIENKRKTGSKKKEGVTHEPTFGSLAIPESLITLYQPQNLSVGYSQNWAEEDGISTDPLFGSLSKEVDWHDMITETGSLGITTSQIWDTITKTAHDVLTSKSANAAMGIVTNPRIGLLFQKTGLRSFQFSFNFMPKSEKEVGTVINIIEKFKYHAAPEIVRDTDSIVNYPELWKIEFHKGDDINEHLFKTTWSALTNITVNYSPQAVWATFKNGMPVNIQMDLQFQEIEAIDKKFIKEGY